MGVEAKLRHNFRAWYAKFPHFAMAGAAPHHDDLKMVDPSEINRKVKMFSKLVFETF